MTFDSKKRAEAWAAEAPALGAPEAEVDRDGVPLDPHAAPTVDVHLRVNAWEAHWLRRMAKAELSSAQRVGRLAVRDAIEAFQLRHQAPRKAVAG